MSMKGYKKLAQGPDHDLSLATEQEGQSNEYGHGAERTASSTDSNNPANGQCDPSTATNADPTTTTTNNSGTMLSLDMDVGEPLIVDTPMNRFRHTLFGKKKALLVGCAAVLIGIVMLSLTVAKFSGHNVAGDSPYEQLISPDSFDSKPVDSDPVGFDPVDSDPVDSKLAHLVQSRLSSISFDSPTSPESKALDWMVNVDEFDQTAVSDDRLVQRFAMVTMVYSMGLDWKSGMLTSESVCTWGYAVFDEWSCNNDGVLDTIWVAKDALEISSLPAAIWLLTGLTTLDLWGGSLTGTIPTKIGLLTGLTTLDISDNYLTGTIPTEIGLLSGLRSLYLGTNDLTGSIPTEIGLFTSLRSLYLGTNDLTGTIPTEIALLTSLRVLHLFNNTLTGSIPTEIGLLTGLEKLYLYNNTLTESIPTEIGLLTGLEALYLGTNDLTGTIPTEIWLLTSLIYLDIADNRLTGTIPIEICDEPYNSFQVDCDKITCSCCIGEGGYSCPAN